jgi:phage-related minor tail protein
MGERGPEAIMPLSRLPDGRLGVANGGGNAAPEIHIHDHAGVSKETKQSTGSRGQPRVDVELRRMVEDMGERMLSSRGSSWQRALSRTIGSNPARTIG